MATHQAIATPDWNSQRDIDIARLSPIGWGWFVTRGRYYAVPHIVAWDDEILSAIGNVYDLLLEAPPRHAKSTTVSRFLPGWYLGHFPDLSVLHASWKVDQSKRWGRRILADLDAAGEIVFGISVDPKSRSAARFDIAGHDGGFLAYGATGGAQGVPANLLITDDLVKGSSAVRSDVQLDHLAEFCTIDLETRREPGCVHIGIETPWHEKDPHGVWRETFPGRYVTRRYPALAEDDDPLGRKRDEPLWPERYPYARLAEIRDAKPALWNALYQCRPTAEEGGVWKRAWWEGRTHRLEDRGGDRWLVTHDGPAYRLADCMLYVVVDLAITEKATADYTVIGCFALTPERTRRLCILDMDRRRMEGPEINPSVRRMLARWGAHVAYYEVAGQQTMALQYARREGLPVKSLGRTQDVDVRIPGEKTAVAHEATPWAAAGRLSLPVSAPWLADWEHEMLVFPNASHDDMEDVTAWAIHVAQQIGSGESIALANATARDGAGARNNDDDEDRSTSWMDGFGISTNGSW